MGSASGGSSASGHHVPAADGRGSGRGESLGAAHWDLAGAGGVDGAEASPAYDVAAVGAWADGMALARDAGAGREEDLALSPEISGRKNKQKKTTKTKNKPAE